MIKLKIINKEEIFERISNGIPYDKNLKPYSKIQIELTLSHFIEIEEYEKCQIIHEFMNQRFVEN
jgi:hypothetical protein